MFGGGSKASVKSYQGTWSRDSDERVRTRKSGRAGSSLIDLLVHSGLAPSRGQARKDIEGGGIYVNNVREQYSTHRHDGGPLFAKYIFLRKGKRTYVVIQVA